MTKVFTEYSFLRSCPNPMCPYHNPMMIPKGQKWYKSHGYYNSNQHGKVPRYLCVKCNKSFSLRTINETWYLHNDEIGISQVAEDWQNGVTQKHIAEKYGISVSMVRTRLRRYLSSNYYMD